MGVMPQRAILGILVGLETADTVDAVRVHWPDGRMEAWNNVGVDHYTTLRQGTAP